MPVYPAVWGPLVKSGNYPHMAKLDAAIWERFLDQFAQNFDLVAYDVAFGGYLPGEEEGDEATRKGWQYSTAMKVDAILLREDECWICEVKPAGTVSGIGGALCYAAMAEAEQFSDLPLMPVLITDRASPDIRYCGEQLGCDVIAVDEPLNPDLETPDDAGVIADAAPATEVQP